MKDFLLNIRTRFGDPVALIAELWINFYIYGSNLPLDVRQNYVLFVQAQIRPLINYFGIDQAIFRTIVEEYKAWLQSQGQTLH